MIVATKVLNTMESYLWKAIRGSGLAYGAYLDYDLEAGATSFSVQRSPNAFLAYREAAKVLKGLADGTVSYMFCKTSKLTPSDGDRPEPS
jgi:Zn-dependent M16 (insulinase) family peptidase